MATNALRIAAVATFVATMGLPRLVLSELTVELPDVAGTYVEAVVMGQVAIPGVEGAPSASLRITGAIVPGTISYCYPPDVIYPAGSEAHLYLYIGGTEGQLWSVAHVHVEPDGGEFVAEGPIESAYESFAPLLALSGVFEFELYIGYDPTEGLSLCVTRVPGAVAIESVEIVSADAVSQSQAGWGAVKSLFR